MTDDELREFAWEFRLGILGKKRSPFGMCFAVSAPLAGLLNAFGVSAELVETDHSNHPESDFAAHFWIRLADGRVLDPTYDQFGSGDLEPVYIGPPTSFHFMAS